MLFVRESRAEVAFEVAEVARSKLHKIYYKIALHLAGHFFESPGLFCYSPRDCDALNRS